jgi:hypothetical protein
MPSGLTVAFALGLTFASCSVYEPSLLTGDGVEGGQASARGGGSGKGGAAGAGGSVSGGRSGTGGGGAGGNGPSAGSSGSSGTSMGGSMGGDAGGAGEAGAAGEDGVGGSSGGSGDGAGGGTSSGGTAGRDTAGNGGRAGAGAPSEAGSAGLAGSAGAGGAGGAGGEVCSGCARLSVPLTSATDRAHFLMTLPANTDFTSAVVTFRVLCKAGSGGQLRGYVQHGGSPDFDFQVIGVTELADLGAWTSVSYELSTVTGFDKTVVRRVGLEVIGAGSSTWLNPTIVYLDSIDIENTVLDPSSFNFDDAASITVTPSTAGPPDQRLWMNNATNDSNVDATLSWLGP